MNRFELDSQKAELTKPTHEAVVSIAEYENLDIAIGVVDARERSESGDPVGRTIIWPQSYMARMDEFETQRLQTIAEALKARVIGVEMPGVGISEKADAKLSLLQKIDLARGNFDHCAVAMLGALNEIVKFEDSEEVEFALYSQGAVLGAHMVENLGKNAFGINVKVPKVTVIEDVNDGHFNYRLTSIDAEDTDPQTKVKSGVTDRYLKENDKYPWLVPPADRVEGGKDRIEALNKKQSTVLNLGAVGLMFASFPDVLKRAIISDKQTGTTKVSESEIQILKMSDSVVSALNGETLLDKLNGNNERTVRRLKAAMPLGTIALNAITAPEGQEGHHHPAVHSMPNMQILADKFMK